MSLLLGSSADVIDCPPPGRPYPLSHVALVSTARPATAAAGLVELHLMASEL